MKPLHWNLSGLDPKQVDTTGLTVVTDMHQLPTGLWPVDRELSPFGLAAFTDKDFQAVEDRIVAALGAVDPTPGFGWWENDGRLPIGWPPGASPLADACLPNLKRFLTVLHLTVRKLRPGWKFSCFGAVLPPWYDATAASQHWLRAIYDASAWYYEGLSRDVMYSQWYVQGWANRLSWDFADAQTPEPVWAFLGPQTEHLREMERIRRKAGVTAHLVFVMPGVIDAPTLQPLANEHYRVMAATPELVGADGLVLFDSCGGREKEFIDLLNGRMLPAMRGA